MERNLSHSTLISLLYACYKLDCIIDIAHAVSLDFSKRLELYQDVGNKRRSNLAEKITELQGFYGFHPHFPNRAIRKMLFHPIFAAFSDYSSEDQEVEPEESDFNKSLIPLLMAARDFSENAQPTGFPMLRERVRSAIVPFRNHLLDVEGSSFIETTRRLKSIFIISSLILRNSKISGVFGISQEINTEWPLKFPEKDIEGIDIIIDTQGAKLIEKITIQLAELLPMDKKISRDEFIRKQRIAEKGANAILLITKNGTGVDGPQSDEEMDTLIVQLYAWGSDLGTYL